MNFKAVLFDLDGTLLPLDQDEFVNTYFGKLAEKMSGYGYDSKEYISAIMKGTGAMMKNDGSRTNAEAFWDVYCKIFGENARADESILDEFYRTDFQSVQAVTSADPAAAEIVRGLRAAGITVILATSPMFPPVATESRIRWAGMVPSDFDIVTTYDNINYCKPNPEYYLELSRRIGIAPEDCLMVGNDVDDDMIAETVGMKVFLLTDNLVNRRDADTSVYQSGGFAELREYLGM